MVNSRWRIIVRYVFKTNLRPYSGNVLVHVVLRIDFSEKRKRILRGYVVQVIVSISVCAVFLLRNVLTVVIWHYTDGIILLSHAVIIWTILVWKIRRVFNKHIYVSKKDKDKGRIIVLSPLEAVVPSVLSVVPIRKLEGSLIIGLLQEKIVYNLKVSIPSRNGNTKVVPVFNTVVVERQLPG